MGDIDIQQFFEIVSNRNEHLGVILEELLAVNLEAFLQPGDYVIDGGANYGMHTIPMSQYVGPTGRVYAVEAAPLIYQGLLINLAEHNIENTCVINIAISNRTSFAERYYYVVNHPAWSGLAIRTGYPDDAEIREIFVPMIQLDRVIVPKDRIKLIKLDLEGGELFALQGATQILAQSHPIIFFESGGIAASQWYNYQADDFFQFFHEHHYQVYDLLGIPFDRPDWNKPQRIWEYCAIHESQADMIHQVRANAQKYIQANLRG